MGDVEKPEVPRLRVRARPGNHVRVGEEPFLLRQSPRLGQLVEATIADLLLKVRVEVDRLDAEGFAHPVQ